MAGERALKGPARASAARRHSAALSTLNAHPSLQLVLMTPQLSSAGGSAILPLPVLFRGFCSLSSCSADALPPPPGPFLSMAREARSTAAC